MNSDNTIAMIRRAGNVIYPDRNAKGLIKRIRFWVFHLTHFAEIRRWINDADTPGVRQELDCAPYLLKTIASPYINRSWSLSERIRVVANHYRQASRLGLTFLNVKDGEYWKCATLQADDFQLQLVFDRPEWMRSEGEWTISLFDGASRIYSASVSLGGDASKPFMYLGAIQGDAPGLSLDLYANLTKIFYGMRPRDLLLNQIKLIAKNIGCTQIMCVSDAQHQSIGRNNANDRLANYDKIWQENGGVETTQGFYAVSAQIAFREISDIPVRKRAMYRRRYDFLSTMDKLIADAIHDANPKIEAYNYPKSDVQ